MTLDVRTFMVLVAVLAALSGAATALYARDLPRSYHRSAIAWALASAAQAGAWGLFAVHDRVPDLLTIGLANLLMLLSLAWLDRSLRLFDGLEPNHHPLLLVVAPAMALVLGGRYLVDAYDLRVVVVAAASALLLAATTRRLLRGASLRSDPSRLILALWAATATGLYALRALLALVLGAPPLTANGALQTVIVALAMAAVVGLIFGYLLLCVAHVGGELRRAAHTDALTALPNRRALEQAAESAIARALRNGHPLSLLLLDLDAFKTINDRFGHAAGDEALTVLATILKTRLRAGDVAARLGGDEFAALLLDADEAEARQVAARLGAAIEAAPFRHPARLGVSVGVATLDPTLPRLHDLLRRADEDLYRVKRRHHDTLFGSTPTPEAHRAPG